MSNLRYQPSYRRNLPHVQPPGSTFFVTFRLAGSLPQSVVRQWHREQQWLLHVAQVNANYYDEVKADFERAWFAKFEKILDGATTGPTWLRDGRVASLVADSLRYRDGKAYRLDAFTIMPNHVHSVLKPLPISEDGRQDLTLLHAKNIEYHSLASIMQSRKGYTAFEANQVLKRNGEFWAHESYDHWIRNAQEWQRIVAYVLNNPVKAGYVKHWRDWKWSYRRKVMM